MNILQFISTFPTEEKCLEHFANLRLERGIKCEKCSCQTKHYWLQSKRFKCSKCKTKSSYKSGTFMEKQQIDHPAMVYDAPFDDLNQENLLCT